MKKLPIILFFQFLLIPACKVRPESPVTSQLRGLELEDKLKLNTIELSGLTVSGSANSKQLYSVSDSRNEIFEISVELSQVVPHKIKPGKCAIVGNPSQFEAITSDKNYFFVLQENSSKIFVVNRETFECERTISVAIPFNSKIAQDWNSDSNSLGEGFILNKNGHILLTKEKDPVMIVEFAPNSESALGFKPGDAVTWYESFPMDTFSELQFSAVKSWKISDQSYVKLIDISDLTVGPDGKLYALSDQSNGYGIIEENLRPDEKHFKVKNFWQFPRKIKKPEGIAIIDDQTIYITTDNTEEKNNFFIFQATPNKQ